jgi:hypothetical protein
VLVDYGNAIAKEDPVGVKINVLKDRGQSSSSKGNGSSWNPTHIKMMMGGQAEKRSGRRTRIRSGGSNIGGGITIGGNGGFNLLGRAHAGGGAALAAIGLTKGQLIRIRGRFSNGFSGADNGHTTGGRKLLKEGGKYSVSANTYTQWKLWVEAGKSGLS